jgi:hypothetical protein
MIHKKGRLRGDKIKYKDGVAYCVWYPFSEDDGEDETGLCFDIAGDDFEDFKALILDLEKAEATPLKEPDAQD